MYRWIIRWWTQSNIKRIIYINVSVSIYIDVCNWSSLRVALVTAQPALGLDG